MGMLTIEIKLDGVTLGSTMLKPMDFTTGSQGYNGQVKFTLDDGDYILSANPTRIHSNLEPEAAARGKAAAARQAAVKAANDAVKRARDNAKMLRGK